MKKGLLFLNLIGICFASCKEEVDPILICGSSNPTDEITIIKEMVENIKSSEFEKQNNYVRSGTYKGVRYIYVGSCCATCYWVPEFYKCDGEKVENADFSIVDLEDKVLIYAHETNTCQFEE